jgi:hypothetical protein
MSKAIVLGEKIVIKSILSPLEQQQVEKALKEKPQDFPILKFKSIL